MTVMLAIFYETLSETTRFESRSQPLKGKEWDVTVSEACDCAFPIRTVSNPMILRRYIVSSAWTLRAARNTAAYSTALSLKGKAKADASADVVTQLEHQGARILRVVRGKMTERARLLSEVVS